MKNFTYKICVFLIISILTFNNCKTSKNSLSISNEEKISFSKIEGDTITISSDVTEYDIIIIEPGFNFWLQSTARPEGFYSQTYLENRNQIYVSEWNRRVLQPQRYNPNLYELEINYQNNIDYGYEVNYKLYNYFIYFQRKYNQRLGPFMPRI
ncbi:hypothetical protein CLV91_1596 [Maribacter vaceletii]|uniref:Uncharacterized protein n=1 Tax=Maribacter vaceletii TaxID=1206816 RepID=A0A495E7J0_9FLAO|nr:DUF6146 family protein [Maribacter vaceletii]RKR12884.1 hypothetical protein CLV91_1596 [Maribacter vaceletii]